MAGKSFDRLAWWPLEKPVREDWNAAASQLDRTLRDLLARQYAVRASAADPSALVVGGFVGDSFRVAPSAPLGMSVVVRAGQGFVSAPGDVPAAIGGNTGVDDLSPFKPVWLEAAQAIALSVAPAAPNSRIDIVEVKHDRRLENVLSRDFLDPATGIFSAANVAKTLAFALDGRVSTVVDPAPSTLGIGYKAGVPGLVPVAPAATAGYTVVAQILVGSAVASVDADVIQDLRPPLFPGGLGRVAVTSTPDLAGNPVSTTVQAPPGVRVVATADPAGPAGYAPAEFFFLSGAVSASVPQVAVLPAVAVAAPALEGYRLEGLGSGTVSAPIQARLLAGQPATKAAVGQPYRSVRLSQREVSALGAPSAPANAMTYFLSLLLAR